MFENFEVREITYEETKNMILNMYYAKRMPSISFAFGLYLENKQVGVVTYGKPASPFLMRGVLGVEHSSKVYELNRLILVDKLPRNTASFFVAKTLKRLSALNLCIVSYSDIGMNHNGYIYQALNFKFTGTTKPRTDKYVPKGKHSRHYETGVNEHLRVYRTPKNRYIYFACDKRTRKIYEQALKYPVLPFPKGENKNYTLGTEQPRIVFNSKTQEYYSE